MSKTQRISENQQCLSDFLLDVQAANRAAGTLQFYREKLELFLAFLAAQDVNTPQQVTPTVVRRFLVSLQSNHTPGGVHAFWRAMRAYMRFLVREEIMERNPLDKVRTPEVDQALLDPVAPETVAALLDTCGATEKGRRDRAIFLTLLDSGLRAGELTALTVGDIDHSDGSIKVHKSKSKRGRVVFISALTRRAIRAYLRCRGSVQDDDWLYAANRNNGQLTYDGLRAIVTRRAKQAGIKPPSLHSFRRAFALAMLRNGADVVSLSRLMGHGSLPVVQRYLKQLKDDLGNVHRQHSPVDSVLGKGRNRDRQGR